MVKSTVGSNFVVDVKETSFSREVGSKALIETDVKAVADYRMKKALVQSQKAKDAEINSLRAEVDTLKTRLERLEKFINGD